MHRTTCTWAVTLGIALSFAVGCAGTRKEDPLLREIRDSTIVPKLGSYDEAEQREATGKVKEALETSPEGTAEILAATLDDPIAEDRTKVVCAYLLSEIADPRAIDTLVEHFGTTNVAAQDLIHTALLNYGPTIAPRVGEILATGDDVARSTAAGLLIDLRCREGYDALWRRLGDERNAEVRFLLAVGISHDPRDLAQARLLRALEDPDELIREYVWGAIRERYQLPERITYDPAAPESERNLQIAAIDRWLHQ